MNEYDAGILALKNGEVRAEAFERLVKLICPVIGTRYYPLEPNEFFMWVNGKVRLTEFGVMRLAELNRLLARGQKRSLSVILGLNGEELDALYSFFFKGGELPRGFRVSKRHGNVYVFREPPARA